MARFQWAEGNLGFYGYDRFGAYETSALDPGGMVLDVPGGAPDATILAARITVTFARATSYVVETGPDAGQVRFTGGTVSALHYTDAEGAALLDITGLKVDLPVFLATLARGDAAAAWAMLTAAPGSFVGAADASGPGRAGTGDSIATGLGNDTVRAGGGDDYLRDQGGADDYEGGTGFDTLAYDGWFYRPHLVTQGLLVDLAAGTVRGPDGAPDTLAGIEAVTGTFRADRFAGDGLANKFAGLAGADRIDGRGGFDIASYAGDAAQGGTDGIRANLAAGTLRDGFGHTDRLVSIEGVEGTAAADSLSDNAGNSWFDGGGGNDLLRFGAGNDTGRGGAGADTFVFRGTAFDDDVIEDFSPAQGDRIDFEAATSLAQLTFEDVTLGGAEAVNVRFGSGAVTLLGLSAADLSAADFGF